MVDPQLLEQFQMLTDSVAQMIVASEQRMKIYMENRIEKRLDSLYDGYKLTHDDSPFIS